MNRYFDPRLITGLIISHALMYFTFYDRVIFWYIFTGSLLVLITYAMFQEAVDDEASFFKYLSIGTVTGLILYFVFWMGIQAFDLLNLPFGNSVNKVYRWFAPELFWQYLALILVAAPGEELFWRGFVQKRLLHYFGPLTSIFIGSLLYASVHVYSGTLMLMLAAFLSGLMWGALYLWKRSMPLVIVSHIVFDIMIFIILPLK